MPDTAHIFSLKSDPENFLIALSKDLTAYGFPPPFDKDEWKHIGMVELSADKLWMYAYKPRNILLLIATVGYYIVAPQVYREILAER